MAHTRSGDSLRSVMLVALVLSSTTLVFGGVASAQAGNAPTCSSVTYTGSGTSGDPYEVSTLDQLQCMGDGGTSLSDDFELTNDIDASTTSGWNGGDGFEPVGESFGSGFEGTFDGNDYVISNLYIDRPSEEHVGLFGYVKDGTVENVDLDGGSVKGDTDVGGLAGYVDGGSVTASSASTDVDGKNTNSPSENVGGLVGYLWKGSVTASSASGDVEGTSPAVGGLVGTSYVSTITDSSASGDVEATANAVGGLVGSATGGKRIENSFATGDVDGTIFVGGLVGDMDTDIKQSYATGDVEGSGTVGGLVGQTYGEVITDSNATGAVTGSGGNVGGLVGIHGTNSEISASNATGSVTGTDSVGGLIGYSEGPVNRSSATGAVDGANKIGGLVGDSSGQVNTSSATGAVDGSGDYVGGLLGYSAKPVAESSATGPVSSSGDFVGGLVGDNSGNLTATNATGAVTGTNKVGGLVGENDANITTSYATGDVTGTDRVGGLVGVSESVLPSIVSTSYATGSVDGSSQVGGLVGQTKSDTTVTDAYAVGSVTGSTQVGGLVGDNEDTVTDSYWDTETTGQDTSAGGTGLTTDEMKGPAASGNLTAFDFTSTWEAENATHIFYPRLLSNVQIPPPGLQRKTTNFSVNVTDTTSPVTETESLDVTVDLTNTGLADGTQTVTLSDIDGTQVDSQSVQLDADESTDVVLTWETQDNDAGTGTVTVASENETATWSVTVTERPPTNVPPVATNDSYVTRENRSLTVAAPGVLGNDTDTDRYELTTAVVRDPSHGRLRLAADGSFEYTPDSGFVGTDSFVYETRDYQNKTDTATVTITVERPPTYMVTITNTTGSVTEGDVVPVETTITNVGTMPGNQTVSFAVDQAESGRTDGATTTDHTNAARLPPSSVSNASRTALADRHNSPSGPDPGTVQARNRIQLDAAERVNYTFNYTTTGEAPEISVAVTTENDTARRLVRVESPTGTHSDDESPDRIESPSGGPNATENDTEISTARTNSTESLLRIPLETSTERPNETTAVTKPEFGFGMLLALLISVVLTSLAGMVGIGLMTTTLLTDDRRQNGTP